MFSALKDSFEMLRDQVWFFRFFVIICVVCIYRTLLHYVLRSNTCANPFCSKCLGTGSVRGRATNHLKKRVKDDDETDDSSLESTILGNLLRHEHLCHRSDEKPTVYFHRGLSSRSITLPDQDILIEHFDELRQELTKFLQGNDQINWTNFYLFQTGEERSTQCQTFPKLFEVLQLLPNAISISHPRCIFGNCFITRFTSDEVPEEENPYGLSNCVLRLHFGLICDDESAAYVLLNKVKRLPITNKKTVLYNDALHHSIRNPNGKQQIFLTIDCWHPDLSSAARKELASIFHTDLV